MLEKYLRKVEFDSLEDFRKNFEISGATSMTVDGGANDEFQVVTLLNGLSVDTSAAVKPWAKSYLELKLDRPQGGIIHGWKPYNSSTKKYESAIDQEYTYSPNDCSVGDVDGDLK